MKILIEVMHGMGDVVCALPMIKEVKVFYPESEITVLVNKKSMTDIINCADVEIGRCVWMDVHKKKIEALMKCLKLRREKFDLAIACAITPVRKSKLIMKVIGAKRIIGIQYKYGKNYLGLKAQYHLVEAHLMALDELEIMKHGFEPRLSAKEEDLQSIKKKLRKKDNEVIVGVCIGRADITYRDTRRRKYPVYTKGWGELELHVKNMESVIQKCLEKGWKVALLGGEMEHEVEKLLSPKILEDKAVCNFVGKTSVAESIAVVSLCDVVMGVDTGMQHVADAAGIPTVSVFGPTNPKAQGAYSNKALFAEVNKACRFCLGTPRYTSCNDRKCLKEITPEHVFDLLKAAVHR